MINNIYKIKSYKEIIDNFEKLSFKRKCEFVNYLFMTGNYDISFEILRGMYKLKLKPKEINRIDYLQLIYHINKNDKYNKESLKYRLINNNPKESWFYKFVCEDSVESQIEIFKELVKSKRIYYLFKIKKYKSKLTYVYLYNILILDEKVRINSIEKDINKTIKKLSRKKDITLEEINYIKNICNILFSDISFVYLKNNKFFIDFKVLYELVNKAIENQACYEDYTEDLKKDFNTIMFYAMRGILNLDVFNRTESQEVVNRINDFVDENIEHMNDDIKLMRKIGKGNMLEELENILRKNNDNIDILHFVLAYACDETENLNNVFEKIDELYNKYSNSLSQNLKDSLALGRELINLWLKGNFNRNNISSKFRTSEFITLIIKLFNNEIPKEEFFDQLEHVENINSYEILNWVILEQKLGRNGNYDWLKIILRKIKSSDDKSLFCYLQTFYLDVLNQKKNIFLEDFIGINEIVINKYDENFYFLANSINIFCYLYEDVEETEKLICKAVENWDSIRIHDKSLFLMNILFIIIGKRFSSLDLKKLKRIIDETELSINKNFLYFCLSNIYKKINLSEDAYKEILKYLFETLKNIQYIDDLLYKIIANVSIVYLEDKGKYDYKDYDLIYTDGNTYFYETTEDPFKKECCEFLNIVETENVGNLEEDHLIMLIISRIFFGKVEEKGVGKMIALRSNATAKEILTELNKAIGYDGVLEEKNKIREGKIIETLWLNVYEFNSIFEDIIAGKWNLFYNTTNRRFLSERKIIHISTLIILCKINKLKIIENDTCYISESIYEETIKRHKKEIIELGRGVFEEAVFYEEYLDRLAISLEIVKNSGRIFSVTKANILPKHKFNKYDDEILKKLLENIKEKEKYCLVSEDPFYLTNSQFSCVTEGTMSLLIDSYKSKVISSEELYDSILELRNLNYNLDIGNVLFSYLVSKATDKNIKKVISVINDYKIATKLT